MKVKAYRCTQGHLVTLNVVDWADGWSDVLGLISLQQDIVPVGDRIFCALCLQGKLEALGVGLVLPPHEKEVDTGPDGRPL